MNNAPVIVTSVGYTYAQGCCIAAILWEGASTSGDTVEVSKNDTAELIWAGRTNTTQTYLGANLGSGVLCPAGFNVGKLSSGRLLVYLRIE
jgi:hypothetical protein